MGTFPTAAFNGFLNKDIIMSVYEDQLKIAVSIYKPCAYLDLLTKIVELEGRGNIDKANKVKEIIDLFTPIRKDGKKSKV